MKIVFATNNPNKVKEVNEVLSDGIEVVSLKSIGCTEEIPETTGTIQGNALQKARHVRDNYDVDCFSEDTGLEIDALDMAPGVDTAYYAGPQRSAEDNMNKVLSELQDKENRGAQFRTVIALMLDGKEYTFEGIARGSINTEKVGNDGFGYDPIFIPEGYETTFAQMSSEVKNKISHRGKAVRKLIAFLNQQ